MDEVWVVINSERKSVVLCEGETDAVRQAQEANQRYYDTLESRAFENVPPWPPARAVRWTPGCCIIFSHWTSP